MIGGLVLPVLGHGLMAAGLFFFVAGTVGLLRFPDVFSRLHAVTKADTVGLGLVTAGLATGAESGREILLLLLIWLLVMVSGAVACQLYARFERERQGVGPEDGP